MKKVMILFSMCVLAVTTAFSQDADVYYNGDEATVTVKAQEAPPAIPDYVQPPCPGDGYLWTPGYWAWGGTGYYWVPGVWVMPPSVGLLWTPGYWGFYNGYYGWHRGYWGEHIGYYGGINYGFGYFGTGFYGGRWEGGHFRYNTAVWHVNRSIHNTYVEEHHFDGGPRASYNGPGIALKHMSKLPCTKTMFNLPMSRKYTTHLPVTTEVSSIALITAGRLTTR